MKFTSSSIRSLTPKLNLKRKKKKELHFRPHTFKSVCVCVVFLPSDLQGGLCGVHRPREARVFSDVGQGHHAVVVGDEDDIDGRQIQQFSLCVEQKNIIINLQRSIVILFL